MWTRNIFGFVFGTYTFFRIVLGAQNLGIVYPRRNDQGELVQGRSIIGSNIIGFSQINFTVSITAYLSLVKVVSDSIHCPSIALRCRPSCLSMFCSFVFTPGLDDNILWERMFEQVWRRTSIRGWTRLTSIQASTILIPEDLGCELEMLMNLHQRNQIDHTHLLSRHFPNNHFFPESLTQERKM